MITLCVPGPWQDRADLSRLGSLSLDFCDPWPELRNAFAHAGQGTVTDASLQAVSAHRAIAYLTFDGRFADKRAAIVEASQAIRKLGGIAVRVESAGLAHEWDAWLQMIQSNDAQAWYRAMVALLADTDHYYSRGMHQFGLADAEAPRSWQPDAAEARLNAFNLARLTGGPGLEDSGRLVPDLRHPADGDPFANPHGLWRLAGDA